MEKSNRPVLNKTKPSSLSNELRLKLKKILQNRPNMTESASFGGNQGSYSKLNRFLNIKSNPKETIKTLPKRKFTKKKGRKGRKGKLSRKMKRGKKRPKNVPFTARKTRSLRSDFEALLARSNIATSNLMKRKYILSPKLQHLLHPGTKTTHRTNFDDLMSSAQTKNKMYTTSNNNIRKSNNYDSVHTHSQFKPNKHTKFKKVRKQKMQSKIKRKKLKQKRRKTAPRPAVTTPSRSKPTTVKPKTSGISSESTRTKDRIRTRITRPITRKSTLSIRPFTRRSTPSIRPSTRRSTRVTRSSTRRSKRISRPTTARKRVTRKKFKRRTTTRKPSRKKIPASNLPGLSQFLHRIPKKMKFKKKLKIPGSKETG